MVKREGRVIRSLAWSIDRQSIYQRERERGWKGERERRWSEGGRGETSCLVDGLIDDTEPVGGNFESWRKTENGRTDRGDYRRERERERENVTNVMRVT